MASEKTASEGLALLSVYKDEDNDMEDVHEQIECFHEEGVPPPALDNEYVDPDKFLPPPPTAKCSDELQEKINKFISIKKSTGRSFNAEVRKRKEYRNPDFMLHVLTYQDIDQIGSCFRKDVFDPRGYDKIDFFDEIEADMKRELERRERKKNQKLEFTPGGVQLGSVVPTLNVNLPTLGLTAVSVGVLNVTSAASNVTTRDIRQNKKSKWDKVDVDQRSSCAYAALISAAAKAGSQNSDFVRQRRKEAEDREAPGASTNAPISHHHSVLGLDRRRVKPHSDEE